MFLLVPAHPGCPGQIPQSRKTVVCVCVSLLSLLVIVSVHILKINITQFQSAKMQSGMLEPVKH